MNTTGSYELSSCGYPLDLRPESWGELEDSSPLRGNPVALRERMDEVGYLFMRDFFPREMIEQGRMTLLQKLDEDGLLDPDFPLLEGVLRPGAAPPGCEPGAVRKDAAIRRVVFGPEMKEFYTGFLGGTVRHFDYVWLRTMGAGTGTEPHCDLVYMGRGTDQLYTAWIPYGDVTYDIGGLIVLEKSHLQADRIRKYLDSDVDTYCENVPDREGARFRGVLSPNPVSLREKFGGRWLSAEFRMGDLLTFRMETVHASLGNQTRNIRLSTDTRYQLASEPVDERWVGENPIGHGPEAKRGLIC